MNFLRLSRVWGPVGWLEEAVGRTWWRGKNFAVTDNLQVLGSRGKKKKQKRKKEGAARSHGFHRKPGCQKTNPAWKGLLRSYMLLLPPARPLDRCPPPKLIIRWLIRPGQWVLKERSVGFDYGSDEATTYGLLYKNFIQIYTHPIFMVFVRDVSGHSVHKQFIE